MAASDSVSSGAAGSGAAAAAAAAAAALAARPLQVGDSVHLLPSHLPSHGNEYDALVRQMYDAPDAQGVLTRRLLGEELTPAETARAEQWADIPFIYLAPATEAYPQPQPVARATGFTLLRRAGGEENAVWTVRSLADNCPETRDRDFSAAVLVLVSAGEGSAAP